MSFMNKLVICAALIGIFFFAAEVLSLPQWGRIAFYYAMLGVAIYGVWMVWKSSTPPPDKAGK